MHDEIHRCQVFILINFLVSFQCFIVKIFNQREKPILCETLSVSTHTLSLRIACDC